MNKPDVIIVGTGAAGLFCALKLPSHLKIVMLTKDQAENSDSYLAQGGICMLRSPEDYKAYYEDTMKAGHYENDPEAVTVMINGSPHIIAALLEYGVDFTKSKNEFLYTKEGAHSIPRILYHDDITGKEITTKLLAQVEKRPNIAIHEFTAMVDLICEGQKCFGVIAENKEGTLTALYSQNVVLATGGIGGLFRYSTNYQHLTGDALGIALKHKIALKNINYIQIHPTTLYTTNPGRSFLISESVRGEGGILLNAKGERFVDELLPRDLLTTAIEKQKVLDQSEYVKLSVVHLGEAAIKKRFPNIYKHCLEEGYDMTKEAIPVTPAQHYFMGGIDVNLDSQTNFDHLYAIGETSCNGVHGANRLASNSLLESLVFAERAADHIAEFSDSLEFIDPKNPIIDCLQYKKTDYKKIVLEAIESEDKYFYEQWCNQ